MSSAWGPQLTAIDRFRRLLPVSAGTVRVGCLGGQPFCLTRIIEIAV